MPIHTEMYPDVKATAEFARETALAARRTIAAEPGTRTPEQLQAGLDALELTARRAEQVLRALTDHTEISNG